MRFQSRGAQRQCRPELITFQPDKSVMEIFSGEFNLLNECSIKNGGIHTPFGYAGSPGSLFIWPVEDVLLYSANYQLEGGGEIWFVVTRVDKDLFENAVAGPWNSRCKQFVCEPRIDSPEDLLPISDKTADFRYYRFSQHPGDLVITWPGSYHSGFNMNWNHELNEAVDFATKDRLEMGLAYTLLPPTRAIAGKINTTFPTKNVPVHRSLDFDANFNLDYQFPNPQKICSAMHQTGTVQRTEIIQILGISRSPTIS